MLTADNRNMSGFPNDKYLQFAYHIFEFSKNTQFLNKYLRENFRKKKSPEYQHFSVSFHFCKFAITYGILFV